MRNNQTLEQVSNVAESKVQLLKNSKRILRGNIFYRHLWLGCLLDWGFY